MTASKDSSTGFSSLKIAIICFINDPFDRPGGRRIGGGHIVLNELGQHLVSRGDDVTYITRLNSMNKSPYSELGPRCRIHRIPVGDPCEMPPSEVGTMLDDLESATQSIISDDMYQPDVLHSQYWIAGEVSRRINLSLGLKHVHYMLSFGRQKAARGEQVGNTDALRDQCEIRVFNAVDCLIAQCPSEARDLVSFYPELKHKRIQIIPHGIDPNVFSPHM